MTVVFPRDLDASVDHRPVPHSITFLGHSRAVLCLTEPCIDFLLFYTLQRAGTLFLSSWGLVGSRWQVCKRDNTYKKTRFTCCLERLGRSSFLGWGKKDCSWVKLNFAISVSLGQCEYRNQECCATRKSKHEAGAGSERQWKHQLSFPSLGKQTNNKHISHHWKALERHPREMFAYGQKPNPLRTICQAHLWFRPSPSPVPLLTLPPHSASFPSSQCFSLTKLLS